MLTYIFRRLIGLLPLVLGITLISFFVIHLAPGKPTTLEEGMNPRVSLEARARLEKLYGRVHNEVIKARAERLNKQLTDAKRAQAAGSAGAAPGGMGQPSGAYRPPVVYQPPRVYKPPYVSPAPNIPKIPQVPQVPRNTKTY